MAWTKNNIKHSCFYTHILMKYITTTFKKARRREWKHVVKVLTLPLKWCIVKGRLSYRYTVSVQFTQWCLTLCNPWTPARQASCPSPTPGVHPKPCPLSWWCHQAISSSVIPFSSCPQSFPASGSFQMSQLFASSGQYWSYSFIIGSVLPMNIKD